MNIPDSEPLPQEAREHLQTRGDELMRQLDAMRESEAQRPDIEPLDADASLALRRHGDQLLANLQSQREELATTAPRKRRFPWVAIAACFTGVIACTWLIDSPDSLGGGQNLTKKETAAPTEPPPVPDVELADANANANTDGDEEGLNPEFVVPTVTVPEPSTGLLTLAGMMLYLRRRRESA